MPCRTGPLLSDEALNRLAREWFADARAQQPAAPKAKPREDASRDDLLLDWLLGGEEGDADCD